MTIPTPIQPAALPSEQDVGSSSSSSSSSSSNIRRNWVHVATPKNKQWTTAMDGVDKLKLTSADLPTPRDGEVLVQIRAVSLNYRDIQVCQGAFNSYNTQSRQQALVPCSDMCGVVLAYPSTSTTTPRFPVGTRVLAIYLQSHLRGEPDEADLGSALGLPLPGVLARYRCFPAASLVAVPAYLSDAEASCLPLAAATAWTALNWLRPLSPSVGAGGTTRQQQQQQQQVKDGGGASKTTVLVQGTTAVALAGLQIAKAAGCRALLTAATDDFAKRAKEQLQADETVNYQTHWAWEGDVLDATGGRGADIIFETGDGARAAAGGSARTLRKSFKCVAFGGVINCIGSPSSDRSDDDNDNGGGDDGKTPELHRLNVNALALARNVTIKGVLNGGRNRLEEALAFYEEHRIKPVVDKTYAFAEAKEAMAHVKQGKQFGKVVITVEDGTNEEEDGDE
ncbi:hypothetical protein MY4824_008329 [Beauveria thailandica]